MKRSRRSESFVRVLLRVRESFGGALEHKKQYGSKSAVLFFYFTTPDVERTLGRTAGELRFLRHPAVTLYFWEVLTFSARHTRRSVNL